jgi:hypothetical protein
MGLEFVMHAYYRGRLKVGEMAIEFPFSEFSALLVSQFEMVNRSVF